MKNNPLVSVIIPCYNYAKHVEQSIASVYNQSYKNIELIVIDDGSTDNSVGAIKKIQEKHKFTLHLQENKGIVFTRNKALELASGEYSIQLDADDILEPDYIEKTVKLALETGADVTYTDYEMFGDLTERSNFPVFNIDELKNHNFVNISALVKKSAVGDVRFDEKLSGKTHEDWDFFLSLAIQGARFVKCSDTHLNYRIHTSGRNNRFSNLENQRSYADTYTYIIEKNMKKRRKDFEYLSGYLFGQWYKVLDDLRIKEDAKSRQKIAELMNENKQLKSSFSWRITTPLRRIRYLAGHIKRSQ